jgi:predicted Zn-dependent peptidase
MHNFEKIYNKELDETVFKTRLKNGLDVYICEKKGFIKKIGLFGTKYGSIINEFVPINKEEKIKVPDGIAHFLEHKLFEQEGANALDLFSKIGVSSNAYTSFDQTVYFFETIDKFDEALSLLVKLSKTPYFTDDNVEKEQGIIGQEISMYDDDPNFLVYFNMLRAMYKDHPIKIDIAGTIDSISKITKDMLYTCYETFYNPSNMFFIVVGDVDIEDTVNKIEENIKIYEKDYGEKLNEEVKIFIPEEKNSINQREIEKKMDIYMPQMCIGYKLKKLSDNNIIKANIISEFVSEMYFSKMSNFFKEHYDKGLISEPLSVDFEGSNTFAHIIISGSSLHIDKLKTIVLNYVEKIKNSEIDEKLFNKIKKKKIGESIILSESLNSSYRRIIESILNKSNLYEDIEFLNDIKTEDIKEFLKNFDDKLRVVSIIKSIN